MANTSTYIKPGNLKIYFGYAAGVGKTYAMLQDANDLALEGLDVLIGYLQPHDRPQTSALAKTLTQLPTLKVGYRNLILEDFDLDQALLIKPSLILVDELAHTNVKGMRNSKRYQDVQELLAAGIDVYTTINVQHLASLNDLIEDITGITVQETIPDVIFDQANQVKLIDIEPEELLIRMQDGFIYHEDHALKALDNFFTIDKLKTLRELAMRRVASRIHNTRTSTGENNITKASYHFLCCIDGSKESSRLIRWTARTALAFDAPFSIIHIKLEDDSLKVSNDSILNENILLAKSLKAEVVILNGNDLASSIATYASNAKITDLVLGKVKDRNKLKNLFFDNLEDQLLNTLNDVDIHMIPIGKKKTKKSNYQSFFKFYFKLIDLVYMISYFIGGTLVSFLLIRLGIAPQDTMLIYILTILLISLTTSSFIYGFISSIIAVLCYDFFFIHPYYSLGMLKYGYPLSFFVLQLVALTTSILTFKTKKQAKNAIESEQFTQTLYEYNKKLLNNRHLEDILNLSLDYFSTIFKRSIIIYTSFDNYQYYESYDEQDTIKKLTSKQEQAVAMWVFNNKKNAGHKSTTLSGSYGYYEPIIYQDKILGVIGLSCPKSKGPLSLHDIDYLGMLSSQLSSALERHALSKEQSAIMLENEKETLRANLLRAISHDLRTPLTGILGASATLEEDIDNETKNELIKGIKEDAQWLIRMVENLLSITKINQDNLNLQATLEPVEEVIGSALNQIKKRFKNRTIYINQMNDLYLVKMDPTLIEQVIINLVENALIHGGKDAQVWIDLSDEDEYVIFKIIDDGVGLSKLSDSSRGMGLGLYITNAILKAHHSKLESYTNDYGGSTFTFKLLKEDNNDYK